MCSKCQTEDCTLKSYHEKKPLQNATFMHLKSSIGMNLTNLKIECLYFDLINLKLLGILILGKFL